MDFGGISLVTTFITLNKQLSWKNTVMDKGSGNTRIMKINRNTHLILSAFGEGVPGTCICAGTWETKSNYTNRCFYTEKSCKIDWKDNKSSRAGRVVLGSYMLT